ncbi:MAG: hypothetical protein KDB23_16035, partial [Planctomycetales bacterium]|nr:hypothetical protein [Planctomycetales bacterium]
PAPRATNSPRRSRRQQPAILPDPRLTPEFVPTPPIASQAGPQPAPTSVGRTERTPGKLSQPRAPLSVPRAAPTTRVPGHAARPKSLPNPSDANATHAARAQTLAARQAFQPNGPLAPQPEELPPIQLPTPSYQYQDEQLPRIHYSETLRSSLTEQPPVLTTTIDRLAIEVPAEHTRTAKPNDDVQINLKVLGNKITRHNYSIRELENELSIPEGWDVPRLQDTASALERAIGEQQHLELFYSALQPEQQARLDQIGDPSIALAQFTQRMFEVRFLYNERSQQEDHELPVRWAADLDQLQQQVQSWMSTQLD